MEKSGDFLQNNIFYVIIKVTLIKRSYLMYTTYTYSEPVVATNSGAQIWAIVATIIAIIGGILIYFLFVKSKQEPKGKFMKWLKDFLSFKTMWLEPILKVMYYVMTIDVILSSFSLIPTNVLAFFIALICGPIVVRLVYELIMMFVMLWRNSQEIANNTRK